VTQLRHAVRAAPSPARTRRRASPVCSCALSPRRPQLPKVAARLPNAPHPENVLRSALPYGFAQCPVVRRSWSGRESTETPPSVHRSPVGTRIDYKRPSSPCLAHWHHRPASSRFAAGARATLRPGGPLAVPDATLPSARRPAAPPRALAAGLPAPKQRAN
jgi:hypothetical protein